MELTVTAKTTIVVVECEDEEGNTYTCWSKRGEVNWYHVLDSGIENNPILHQIEDRQLLEQLEEQRKILFPYP